MFANARKMAVCPDWAGQLGGGDRAQPSAEDDRAVTVHLFGGVLRIAWREQEGDVLMTGPAREVFTGDWPDPEADHAG